ncbi:SCP-like extracellular protein [Bacillus mesophilus]|uniref:SCP-like extracellular protein n=2 Tax=Bacillus mesophilus TaxID=1808955 RepID=A0A6M0QBM1_9BACI|nr:SCP-like extracellular protein [Bacillus mesophilus]
MNTQMQAQEQNATQQQTVQKQAQEQNQQQQAAPKAQEMPKGQAAAPAPKQDTTTQNQAAAPAPKQDTAQAKPEQKAAAGNTAMHEFESKVIELTNAERRKNGLKDLAGDNAISNVAREKSTDMQKNNYFSHTSPTYGSPFDMMRDFGITYNTAGENIAQGQRTPEEVVQAWMNSEGHRKNILSDKFTHIGVGYDQNGHHWTQMFVGR